jgi:putative DNA primase/helicase
MSAAAAGPAAVRRVIDEAEEYAEQGTSIRAIPLDAFLKLVIKPRAQLLAPILREKDLAMLYAPRGTGKTFLGLAIAYAVASGGSLMRWRAPTPRKVLYIDGEMPTATLQERLSNIVTGASEQAPSDSFMMLPADLFENGLPNLATPAGQAAVEPLLDGIDLVLMDNQSTLASVGRDNEADSWESMQTWLLRLRRRGHAVLLIHHAGKGGQQRGTSRREDVLDTVIALRHPDDYVPSEGARFNVHFEKARGVYGDDVKPFEAKLTVVGGGLQWTYRDLDDADRDRVTALKKAGLSIREIAEETGLSKSTVHRLKQKAEEE